MRLRLSIILLFFILYSLFFIPIPLSAQEASPTASPVAVSESKNPLIEFFKNLLAAIKGGEVDTTLEDFNKANLPNTAKVIPVKQPKEEETEGESFKTAGEDDEDEKKMPDTDPIYNTASQYTVASWVQTPKIGEEKRSTNLADFFADIIGDPNKVVEKGDKKAIELAHSQLPMGVAEKALSRVRQSPGIADNISGRSAQVLGYTTAAGNKSVMPDVLSLLQCAKLPHEVGERLGCRSPEEKRSPIPGEEEGEGTKLDYVIPYYKIDAEESTEIDNLSSKFLNQAENIKSAVKREWMTSLIGHWREVYDNALAKNWNPVFVLAVWIEETAASDVCSIESRQGREGIWDFGVVSLPKTYCSESLEVKLQKFHQQLSSFLSLVEKYKSWYKKDVIEFEEFMCRYSEGHYPCTFDINPGFVKRLKSVYDCLVSKSPSEDTCPSGYFDF